MTSFFTLFAYKDTQAGLSSHSQTYIKESNTEIINHLEANSFEEQNKKPKLKKSCNKI